LLNLLKYLKVQSFLGSLDLFLEALYYCLSVSQMDFVELLGEFKFVRNRKGPKLLAELCGNAPAPKLLKQETPTCPRAKGNLVITFRVEVPSLRREVPIDLPNYSMFTLG
jgi:hypothetical protein